MNAIAPPAPSTATAPLRVDPWYDGGANSPTDLARPAPTNGDGLPSMWGDDGFTFGDILDIINPLHHVPLVGSVYRHLSADEIAPASRLAGAALFGGGLGAVVAGLNLALESATGQDVGDMLLATVAPEPANEKPATEKVAANIPPALPEKAVAGAVPTTPVGSPEPPSKSSSPGIPVLSPQAFDTLIRSLEAPSTEKTIEDSGQAEKTAQKQPVAASTGATVAAGSDDHRQAAIALHRLLAERYHRPPHNTGSDVLPILQPQPRQ